MGKKRIALLGLAQASCTALYVTIPVIILTGLDSFTSQFEGNRLMGALIGMGVLLFFITSASITGALVFGYPTILALRQRTKEAVLLAATISWLALFCKNGLYRYRCRTQVIGTGIWIRLFHTH